ncbi:uncharacterized protein PFL1_03407 [Pseudozyma flocculosa PF-1]|uniref:Metallo-beta-lactamase domain-containing protein n=2 Tax=Pseudozyma flocculosa TaxID=84751 RepID=A0A5C3F6G9_9BASI|nr:uncharacterized protein PFL1_03407 [Pseudozyma flocculosa PF-1]EPQ29119.1 hypothetical protein PFL1_03407 [Pseudozyma flocculosa PF-1]SPO40113.1 uncharacterized protein PSFLO_05595 [Pseudozyma flocculosa]
MFPVSAPDELRKMNGHGTTSLPNGGRPWGDPVKHRDPKLPLLESSWLRKVVFLGTGTSGQVPAIHCVTSPDFGGCATCADAVRPGSRNHRGCTSVALVGRHSHDDDDGSTILIDCGKTFYSSALVHFPRNGIRRLKAVLLTHAHADAILGLDDLRAWTMGSVVQPFVDIYLTEQCMQTVQGMFPYLVDRSKSTGGGDVGTLRWHIIDPDRPFWVGTGRSKVEIQPLPVLHGFVNRKDPFWTLGFRIDGFSYVSDTHSIPETTTQIMAGSEVIVMDALKMDRHSSHFSFSQALSFLASLPPPPSSTADGGTASSPPRSNARLPKLGILTDFTHRIEHFATQELLDAWRRGLMDWQVQQAPAPSERAGKGEAGGPRWWDGVWDEADCERRLTIALKGEADKLSRDTHGSGDGDGDGAADREAAWRAAPHWIPPVAMSWDGMVIEFQQTRKEP